MSESVHPLEPVRRAAAWWPLTRLASRTERSVWLLLALAGVIAATVPAAADAWSDRQQVAAIDGVVEAAADVDVTLIVRSAGLVTIDETDPFGSITEVALAGVAAFGPTMTQVLEPSNVVVQTAWFGVRELDGVVPATPTSMVLRVDEPWEERSTLIDGRRAEVDGTWGGSGHEIEIELSVASAAELDVEVGDVLATEVSFDDALGRRYRNVPGDIDMVVVGIVDLLDADDPSWFGDERLHRPVVIDTPVGASRVVSARIPPEALVVDAPFVAAGAAPFGVEWRSRLDRDMVSDVDVAQVRDEFRSAEAVSSRTTTEDGVAVVTNATGVLAAAVRDATSVERALERASWVFTGALAAAIAVSITSAARERVGDRRRAWERGASGPLLVTATSTMGAAAVAFGVAVGVAVVAVAGRTPMPTSVAVALASAAGAGAVATGAMLRGRGVVDADGVSIRRVDGPERGWPSLRIVMSGVAVVVAAVAVAAVAAGDVDAWSAIVAVAAVVPPAIVAWWSGARLGSASSSSVAAGLAAAAGWAWWVLDPSRFESTVVVDVVRSARYGSVVTVALATCVLAWCRWRRSDRRAVLLHPGRSAADGGPEVGVARSAWRSIGLVGVAVIAAAVWLAILVGVVADGLTVGSTASDGSVSGGSVVTAALVVSVPPLAVGVLFMTRRRSR